MKEIFLRPAVLKHCQDLKYFSGKQINSLEDFKCIGDYRTLWGLYDDRVLYMEELSELFESLPKSERKIGLIDLIGYKSQSLWQ